MQDSFKWIARVGGGVVCVFFLVAFLANGFPLFMRGGGGDLYHFIPYGVVAIAGYLLGWKKPFAGGLVLVLSSFLFFFYFMSRDDLSAGLAFGVPALLTGLSYVASVHKALV
jgi:hypothetical protein